MFQKSRLLNSAFMKTMINVGFGEYKISTDPESVLVSFGLGSCVAITFYDPVNRIGGMIHVVLPTANGKVARMPGRYADTGIPLLIEEMRKAGARPEKLIVKMAGGAKIIKRSYAPSELDIGKQNIERCLKILKMYHFVLCGQAIGGHKGRTVKLFIDSGKTCVGQAEMSEI